MPTLEHDGVVRLFRDNPSLAPRVIEDIFRMPLPAHATIRVADCALDQMLPIEFRADLVLEVLNDEGACVLAIVLESQREITARKKYSWPVYVTVSRAERECEAVILVVAVDAEVAAWAAKPIDVGFGLCKVETLVLGPSTLPQITDERTARENMELAVLSGMAHGNGTNGEEVLRAAVRAIVTLDAEHGAVYFQIIWNVLREPMQRALERLAMENQHVDGGQKEWDLVRIFRSAGFHDGEAKGFHDGEAKGELKGELKARRANLLRGAKRRGLVLTEEQQQRILACDDHAMLERWFDNVFDAKTADELFD